MKNQVLKEIQMDDKSPGFLASGTDSDKKQVSSYPAFLRRELKPFIFEVPGKVIICTVGDKVMGMMV